MNATKLVCVQCQTELRPKTNGILLIETASFGPYKVWAADTWKCPGCGVEIVSGFSDQPLRQDHYRDDFSEWLQEQIKIAPRVIYDHERPQNFDRDVVRQVMTQTDNLAVINAVIRLDAVNEDVSSALVKANSRIDRAVDALQHFNEFDDPATTIIEILIGKLDSSGEGDDWEFDYSEKEDLGNGY